MALRCPALATERHPELDPELDPELVEGRVMRSASSDIHCSVRLPY
jgi:hypothetical protein